MQTRLFNLIVTLLLAGQLTFATNNIFKFDQNVIGYKETHISKGKSQPGRGTTTRNGREYGQHAELFQSEKKDPPSKCGYPSCSIGKEGMLNVHLVPHTHDDVGWVRTVDQYYYGVNHAGVQYILDSAISELNNDPIRRFIYVEIAFFARWWDEQHDSTRHVVKRLVNEGRLEFILGGWCMNDEAGTHYNAIIDQHTVGFRFLEQNFGECGRPRIAWQIDPFGHSREQASLFAQFGFDGLFFGRLDFQDKAKREKTKTMELMWRGSDDLGAQGDLFTGVNYNGYNSPPGFNFNVGNVIQIMDDRRLEDYNVDVKVEEFLKYVKEQASRYTTSDIMLTMGGDFWYEAAHINYKNMDKLIHYVNNRQGQGSRVNVFYSTPSCYLYALNRANQTYSTKSDDFFPYASRGHTFWTGYFTSRPALKGYVRQCNNFLQVCKQLDVLAELEAKHGSKQKLRLFKRAMGVAQHHDAVSGTEQQHVARDYAKRLATGAAACQEVVNSAYGKLLPRPGVKQAAPVQHFCNLLNVSVCSFTETNKNFTVTMFNPIGRAVIWWVTIPVTQPAYTVLGSNDTTIKAQVVPLSAQTRQIPAFNGSKATGELVFQVQLPPLGLKTFFIEATMKFTTWREETNEIIDGDGQSDITIKNQYLSLTVDGSTGLLKSVTNLESSLTASVKQSLLFYKAFKGNTTSADTQSSGAYIFRPNGFDPVVIGNSVKVQYMKGSQVQEIRQVFSDWASQVIRLYADERQAEFEWTIGPIPVRDDIGKEVISRFSSSLASQSQFYTDANGRQILKRIRDFRPTWKLNQTEEVAGNYYPVNSRIFIRDEKKQVQLTVLTDRSQGGASIRDGEIELMVHRRLLVDDRLGVGEPLNETGISGKGLVVRGKHYLQFDTIKRSASLHRDVAERLFMAPSVSFSQLSTSPAIYNKTYYSEWSGLKRALPANVHLLTLEEWEGPTYLLRLEHFYEKDEDAALSKPATVSLKGLFSTFEVKSVEELTLGANQLLKDAKRLRWNVAGQGSSGGAMSNNVTPVNADTLEVKLQPMQIRTFKVIIQGRH